MDLVRQIMLKVRASDEPISELHFPEAAKGAFGAHVQLLQEAGLVVAAVTPPASLLPATSATIWRLTWAGHEFADAVVSDTLWNKAKTEVMKPAGSWTFSILGDWLKAQILAQLPTM